MFIQLIDQLDILCVECGWSYNYMCELLLIKEIDSETEQVILPDVSVLYTSCNVLVTDASYIPCSICHPTFTCLLSLILKCLDILWLTFALILRMM